MKQISECVGKLNVADKNLAKVLKIGRISDQIPLQSTFISNFTDTKLNHRPAESCLCREI